jgi:biopolymer transport protein ExbB/TolQ
VEAIRLSWARQDFEQRLGIPGCKWTGVNSWFVFVLGALITLGFYGILLSLSQSNYFYGMFVTRGNFTVYSIVFFSAWAVGFLIVKWRKVAFQRRALEYLVVPQDADFVLSTTTVGEVISNIYDTVDDPKYFVLFNRIVIALSNLRNLGQVTDVDDILRSQADHDESVMETSYALLRGLIWAIPVLGFIGTVLGLSDAIGQFSGVLQTADDISMIKDSLKGVTGGLATAFETTLQALVAALFIQMMLTFLKKSEEEFLDSCKEYCAKHVVNRLRIMPYELVED